MARFGEAAVDEGLVDVTYTTMDSPIGSLLLAATDEGVVRIHFEEDDGVLDELARKVSPRVLRSPRRLDPVRRQLDEYFAGRRRSFSVALDRRLIGSFGERVLARTERIPFGSVAAYNDVAWDIGAPRAARAVGNALGANPIPVVIPCHRVLRTGGSLGGYGGGLDRKRYLLELEGALPKAG
ncbi:MAG: methylated-DNA--[protein]-cysteine S-methyltransferase [Chloroflexi bacterium]|nr:methylated-DNA--[protein]-cysteine S-methyltransferase [Chloroflexota bacterium]